MPDWVENVIVGCLIVAIICVGSVAFVFLVSAPFALIGWVAMMCANIFNAGVEISYWRSFAGGFGLCLITAVIRRPFS